MKQNNQLQRRTRKQTAIRLQRTNAHLNNRADDTPKHKRLPRNTNGCEIGQHRNSGLGGWNGQALYFPKRKKLKGWQKDHQGRKIT